MAWTVDLKEFETGDYPLGADFNAIRDNILELAPGRATAPSLMYADRPNHLAELLLAGHAGDVVRMGSDGKPTIAGRGIRQWAFDDASGNLNSGSAADVASASLTTLGGEVLILATIATQESKTSGSAAEAIHHAIIRRDSTDLKDHALKNIPLDSAGAVDWASFAWQWFHLDQGLPAASYTWKTQAYYTASSTSGTPTVKSTILVLELTQ
jgi:hypothetical protein